VGLPVDLGHCTRLCLKCMAIEPKNTAQLLAHSTFETIKTIRFTIARYVSEAELISPTHRNSRKLKWAKRNAILVQWQFCSLTLRCMRYSTEASRLNQNRNDYSIFHIASIFCSHCRETAQLHVMQQETPHVRVVFHVSASLLWPPVTKPPKSRNHLLTQTTQLCLQQDYQGAQHAAICSLSKILPPIPTHGGLHTATCDVQKDVIIRAQCYCLPLNLLLSNTNQSEFGNSTRPAIHCNFALCFQTRYKPGGAPEPKP
jgi:hypothetical protein